MRWVLKEAHTYFAPTYARTKCYCPGRLSGAYRTRQFRLPRVRIGKSEEGECSPYPGINLCLKYIQTRQIIFQDLRFRSNPSILGDIPQGPLAKAFSLVAS